MRQGSRFLIAGLVVALVGADARHEPVARGIDDVSQVHICLVDWSEAYQNRQSYADVMNICSVAFDIRDQGMARSFVASLRLDEMTPREGGESGDARLAIEVIEADGSTQKYYASYSVLYSEGGLRSRAVDASFRRRFDIAGVIP